MVNGLCVAEAQAGFARVPGDLQKALPFPEANWADLLYIERAWLE